MKGLVILGNGFEDTEAIATIDVLKRSRLEIVTAAFDSLEVVSKYNLKVQADMLIKDVRSKDYDFLVIPGGRAVFSVLDKKEEVTNLIREFHKANKLVASICAGPSQVGKLGLFKNHQYTCFPGCEGGITEGKYCPEKGVIVDGNFITAKAMAYALDFALAIVEYLQGKKERELVEKSIHGMR
ncbi:MAG: DJ-1/PfpI family protein [Acholeplasmataceae bacterium]|jgi:4-methyl-5(b-hydroxyethyl)-thiazole monophosphate biosynthesis|nr:DJ-1/PfpI family protein [Acholeplasmataceae bacterium]